MSEKCVWYKVGVCKEEGCRFSACIKKRKGPVRLEFFFVDEEMEWSEENPYKIERVWVGWKSDVSSRDKITGGGGNA